MKRYREAFLLKGYVGVAICLMLAACTAYTPKTIQVKNVVVSHIIIFEGNTTQISVPETRSLEAFLQPISIGAISYVDIALNDTSPKKMARAKRIKRYLVKQGISSEIIYFNASTNNDNHTVVLTIEYSKAIAPKNCPDWSKNSSMDYAETNYSNFGCAYYTNIAAQVYTPADLERGHGTPTISGARESVYIQNYTAGTPPSTSSSSSSSSSSSPSSTSR